MITKFRLFESPDNIYGKDGRIVSYRDTDSRTFGYYNGNFYAADHYDVWHGWDYNDRDPLVVDEEGEGEPLSREDYDYPGRLWLDSKIISFWIYPENREKMREVIKDLENYYDIEMWNDPEWKIEILTNYETDPEEYHDFSWDENDEIETDIIRLSDYKSSGKRSEEELRQQHVLSPMDKDKEKPKGWKPKKYKYQLPGESEVEARYRVNKYMYQESKKNYIYVFIEMLNGLVESVDSFLTEKDAKNFIVNRIHKVVEEKDYYDKIKNIFDADELLLWWQEEYSVFGREFYFWRTKPESNVNLDKELALRRETNKFNL